MAYTLIKLTTGELVISDCYCADELIRAFQITDQAESNDKNDYYMIDPVLIQFMALEDGGTETRLVMYMPYTEENILPFPAEVMVTTAVPDDDILTAYLNFVDDQKRKREARKSRGSTGPQVAYDAELDNLLKTLDPKKTTIN